MRKSILIVAPPSSAGQPVTERVDSFAEFFLCHEIACEFYPTPQTPRELLQLVQHIYREKWRNVFVTMPPFRNWSLCMLPGVHVILDIRDGWSIGMRSGYGGTTKPQKIKSRIARIVEQVAIRLSTLTITCTPGLLTYHETTMTKGKLVLIENGFPGRELARVAELRSRKEAMPPSPGPLVFICAGKFSEYGIERCKQVIDKISQEFSDNNCVLKIFSVDPKRNDWIREYISERNIKNINFESYRSIERLDLLEEIVKSDYGISIVRDQNYEFGTKVFDYLVCGLKILDYIEKDGGSYAKYFNRFFSENLRVEDIQHFSREMFIAKKSKVIFGKIS
ncbi:hypothetical protein ASD44_01465 [Mesorhizobium sp. Root554]|uniref:hypothetical protein n=1 Tax=unclassified Mesorhizobium TaxID=325217 RepID=UPI0006F21BB4|nr:MULTISPECIES: hypothetical protein [unclassified Mesorhizobium]KQZ12882.1 hypothetical protein ASD27_01470 [Mesorhizobium sp. Root1471]KQZ35401.1 hypothetical protein ASD44_01465 [Mesorhizobium sp. Root554]